MVRGLAISGMDSVDYAENGTGAVATYVALGPDADMVTWTHEGADAGEFDISSGGELTFVSAPDYENPADADMDNTYMVTVKATDGTYMDTHEVTVMVTNVDELETVTLSATQPQIGTEITASLTDDGDKISGAVSVAVGQGRIPGRELHGHPGSYVGRLHAGGSGREYVPAGNGDVQRRA